MFVSAGFEKDVKDIKEAIRKLGWNEQHDYVYKDFCDLGNMLGCFESVVTHVENDLEDEDVNKVIVLGYEKMVKVPDDSLRQDSCLPINRRCAEADEFSESKEEEDIDAELEMMTKVELYHTLGSVMSDIDKTSFDLKAALLDRRKTEFALTEAKGRVNFFDNRIRYMTNFTVKLQHHISRSNGRHPAASHQPQRMPRNPTASATSLASTTSLFS